MGSTAASARGSGRPGTTLVVLAAVVVGLAACAAPTQPAPTQPDPAESSGPRIIEHFGLFLEYGSAEELAAAADAVVSGVILDKHTELVVLEEPEFTGSDPESNPNFGAPEPEVEPEPAAFVYTVYEVEVSEAVQGRYDVGDVVEVRLVGGEHGAELHVWDGVEHPDVGESYAFFLRDVEGGEAEALNPTQSLFLEVADGEFEPVSPFARAAEEIADELGVALD